MNLFIQKLASFSILFLFTSIIEGSNNMISIPKGANRIPDYVAPPEVIYVNDIRIEFAKEVKKEFGINAIGFGSCMPEKVDEIAVQFQCDKQVNIDEARWLMITLKQKLADKVNQHEKIRPFLAEYPFPSSRADITLSFKPNSNKNIKNVDFVHIGRGRVFYCKSIDKTFEYDRLLIEQYEDALKNYNATEKPLIFKKFI